MKFLSSKKHSGFTLLNLLICVAIIGILATFTLPKARAQIYSGGVITTATNLPSTVATTVTTNCNSYIPVFKSSGLAGTLEYNVSSGTSNVVLCLYPTVDGTNYANTIGRWHVTNNAAGTTTNRMSFSFSAIDLNGIRGFQIGLYNQNAGTLTNRGLILNRPQ